MESFSKPKGKNIIIAVGIVAIVIIVVILVTQNPLSQPPPQTPPPYYLQEYGEVRLNVHVNSPGYVKFYIDDEEEDWGYADSSDCYVWNYMGFIELEVGTHTFYAKNIDGSTQIISYTVQKNEQKSIYLGGIP